MTYLCLLRGINISGKNKISMADLKSSFELAGFENIKTLLNSGNVVFDSAEFELQVLSEKIRKLIQEKFKLDIPVFVISKNSLEDILKNSPEWWGTGSKEIYDNLIFLIPPATTDEIQKQIGEPNEFEKIHCVNNAIFWSYDLDNYRKTVWWPNTAKKPVCDMLTIRIGNTIKKIINIM